MSAANVLSPHDPTLEPFVYALLGEDQLGRMVTVLSAFARQGLDPWAEAGRLAAAGREGATVRIGLLLSRCADAPDFMREPGQTAHRLAALLPDHSRAHSGFPPAPPAFRKLSAPVIAAAAVATFVLLQLLLPRLLNLGL